MTPSTEFQMTHDTDSAREAPKLTKTQIKTLVRIAERDMLAFLSGRSAHYFWHSRIGDRAPSTATVNALSKAGCIKHVKVGVGAHHVVVTDAGRAALAREGGK